MRVLVGCEFSGVVRDAFARRGHTAVSCDYGPSESAGGKHVVGDVRELLDDGWDMLIVFPDCTYLTVANNKSMQRGCSKYTAQQGQALRTEAIDLFMRLAECAIPKTAIENPIGIMSTRYRKPDQIVQPWQFGEDASKATCLWLKGLPLLRPTNVLPGGKAARRRDERTRRPVDRTNSVRAPHERGTEAGHTRASPKRWPSSGANRAQIPSEKENMLWTTSNQ